MPFKLNKITGDLNLGKENTNITPVTVKGGVVRVIDSATGDIYRTTASYFENDIKFGWRGVVSATAVSFGFDSAVTRTGRLTLKISTTDATGAISAATTAGGGATYAGDNGSQLIPIKPSTNYKLTCFVKTNNVALNSVYVNLQYWDSNKANRVDSK